MRILRIAALIAAALIGVLIVGAIALSLFVDPNRYRGDIERAAIAHTGRQLTIAGPLHLKLFPWIALSVSDVQLGNAPGYGRQPFLVVQRMSVGVKLLPLLAKRIEVSRIDLEGLTANLVSRGDSNNWKDLSEPRGARPTAPTGQNPTAAALSIGGIDVEKATLVYRDETRESSTQISNLDIHTGRLSAGPSGSRIDKLEVQGSYLSQSAANRPTSEAPRPLAFSLRAPQVALDAAQSLAPTQIDLRFGELTLNLTASGEKVLGDRVLQGTLVIPKISPRELLKSLGAAAPVTRDPQALTALALKANYRLTAQTLTLSDLDLSLDDTRVQGQLAVEDFSRNALAFELNVGSLNLDRYRAPAPPAKSQPAQKVPPQEPTPLPLETLRKLDVHGTLRVNTATFASISFTNLTAPLVAKNGHIHLGPMRASLYGGQYDGDVVLDARPVQAQLSLNQHIHGTDVGALVKAAYDSTRLSGHADSNVAVTGVGNSDEAIIRSLSGKMDAIVKQGALNGIDVQYELQSATALVHRQIPPPRKGPSRTVFNSLETTATLDKGVLRDDDLRIETDFLKVHGSGTLDLASQGIDYKLIAGFYKAPPQSGTGSGLTASQSLEVPLSVTGTLANPKVRPDLETLAKGELRQQVQKKAGDLLKGTLGDKLKDLLRH